MSIMASAKRSFEPAPEGLWPAVCVDVADIGMVVGQFGEKHKLRITWEISERMKTGEPYIASKQYTVSLHEKASLHKDLKSWRGKPFTAEELAGFDVEKVLGAPCQLLIEQEEKDGMTYGNIKAVMKADKRTVLKPSGKFVRAKDRKPKDTAPEEGDPFAEEPHDDGDPDYESGDAIPF